MFVGTLNALDYVHRLNKNSKRTGEVSEKVSSGKRLNKAADDAAGVTISEGMRAQIRGLSQGQRNTQDGVSLLQTADGAMQEISDQMKRMKEISVEAANGTCVDEDRQNIGKEFDELKNAIQGIVDTTEFNGIKLLDKNKSLIIQTKDNPYMEYTVKLYDTNNSTTGINTLSVNTQAGAFNSISELDKAMDMVASNRVKVGIDLNNLQHEINGASNTEINTTSSLSIIEDANMATSLMDLVKNEVITNYSQSMFTTANSSPKYIAQLLS
ncbi:flagellin [Clostridium sp. JS66]|uniref:flagellin n=1 Tax=Clostridium sp. JS66 TaxID=3064705 RepID=UPI00298DBA98|nr:flagellin [Clostridium sp. JS66]WPC41020.1 flagellin [Clostridium sp. JS66]